ncbi:MAG: transglycosylase SLT domain-containing protein [Gemmatimonadales bacterium]
MLFVGRGRAFGLPLTGVVLAITACAPSVPLGAPGFAPPATETPQDHREERAPPPKPVKRPAAPKPVRPPAVRIDSAALELAVVRQHAHVPLAMALARRSRKPDVAHRAASAVVREAERLRLSPSLLAAVLLIENAPLDTGAVSSQGAIGLMQIMPFHSGSFGCQANLLNLEANICHGARLLKNLVRRSGSMHVALRRYNGCVRGRNTPRCHRYPGRVLRTASRLRREVLVTAADSVGLARETLAAKAGAAEIPSQPVVSPDSTAGGNSGLAAPCTTFFGCLRYRWTLTY